MKRDKGRKMGTQQHKQKSPPQETPATGRQSNKSYKNCIFWNCGSSLLAECWQRKKALPHDLLIKFIGIFYFRHVPAIHGHFSSDCFQEEDTFVSPQNTSFDVKTRGRRD